MKKVLKVLFPILTVLFMLFIFSNSFSSGEVAGAKRGFVVNILSGLIRLFTGEEIEFTEKNLAVVSKLFHVFEFFLFSLSFSFSVFLRREKTEGAFQSVLLGGVMTALADEQLQMLFSGRGSRLSDVFVDLAGILIGFGISFVLAKIWLKGENDGKNSSDT